MQYSNLPDELKSPSLANEYPNTGPLSITFSLPSEISNFEITSGNLSQPMSIGAVTYQGVLSQPIFPKLEEFNLVDDLGNNLVDDLGNQLTGLFFPEVYTVDPGTRIVQEDVFFDGVLAQVLYVLGTNEFNCIGIGGTDATQITINSTIIINSDDGLPFENGLYDIGQTLQAGIITIDHNGSYIGRIAVGKCIDISISPTREVGFMTTSNPRTTLSGQRIAAVGGYSYRKLGVDFIYKFTKEIIDEIKNAYPGQIAQGYPFFFDFTKEKDWIEVTKFYGYDDNNMIFQSSVNRYSYSRGFQISEAF